MYQVNRKKLWLIGGGVGFALALLLVFWWVATHSFITVSVEGNSSSAAIRIIDQTSGETIEKQASSGDPLKLLVKKGDKEISAKIDEKTQIAFMRSGGFLKNTEVSLSPQPEKARSFIGNNPAPCMQTNSGVLYSYTCSGNIAELQIHTAATATEPTFVKQYSGSEQSEIIGSKIVGPNLVVLARDADEGDALSYSYRLITVDPLGNKVGDKPLTKLKKTGRYATVDYKDGLLAYASDFKSAVFVSLPSGAETAIDLSEPNNDKLVAYTLSVSGDKIVVAYSSEEVANSDSEDEGSSNSDTEVVIQDAKTQHLKLPKHFASVLLCGADRLCAVGNERLSVFDISDEKIRELYSVRGVNKVFQSADTLVFQRAEDLLKINISTQKADSFYSYGEYRPCGISASGGGFTLCAINKKNEKVALFIDANKVNADSIDKKISSLRDDKNIKDMSINGRYIFITPELGERKYIPSIGGFGYDPGLSSSVFNSVKASFSAAGVNATDYTVINIRDLN